MMSSKDLTQLSVATAAMLVSLGIGRTTHTSKVTYWAIGNQPLSTDTPSSWADGEAEAAAAIEAARKPFAIVDNSIEPEWLLNVPSSNKAFSTGLTDQELEGMLKRLSGEGITYTHWALNELNNEQASVDVSMVGEKHTTTKRQKPKVHNDASNAYITARRMAESVNNAIAAKISSVLDAKSERACY